MIDQPIIVVATIVQDILLLVSTVLIAWYLYETRKMRKAAEHQVTKSQELVAAAQRQVDASLEQAEAASRPAIVAKTRGSTMAAPVLENIGNGPAIDVKVSLSNSDFELTIPYLEPKLPLPLSWDGTKPLYEAALKVTPNAVSIECAYRSLSGWSYSSTNKYDLKGDRFDTTFSHGTRWM